MAIIADSPVPYGNWVSPISAEYVATVSAEHMSIIYWSLHKQSASAGIEDVVLDLWSCRPPLQKRQRNIGLTTRDYVGSYHIQSPLCTNTLPRGLWKWTCCNPSSCIRKSGRRWYDRAEFVSSGQTFDWSSSLVKPYKIIYNVLGLPAFEQELQFCC